MKTRASRRPPEGAGGRGRVARLVGGRGPQLVAGGGVERDDAAAAAADVGDDPPVLDEGRAGGPEEPLAHAVAGVGVDLPEAGAGLEVDGVELALRAEGVHPAVVHDGHRPRPLVEPEVIAVAGGVVVAPDGVAGAGVESLDDLAPSETVEQDDAAAGHRWAREARPPPAATTTASGRRPASFPPAAGRCSGRPAPVRGTAASPARPRGSPPPRRRSWRGRSTASGAVSVSRSVVIASRHDSTMTTRQMAGPWPPGRGIRVRSGGRAGPRAAGRDPEARTRRRIADETRAAPSPGGNRPVARGRAGGLARGGRGGPAVLRRGQHAPPLPPRPRCRIATSRSAS